MQMTFTATATPPTQIAITARQRSTGCVRDQSSPQLATAQLQKMAVKVICIHGTESGGSERHAKRLSKSWPKASFDQSKDFMSGNDAASVGLEALAAKYDAFVIVSSSYGDGDPPSNFENFLRALYTADENVLAGKQHCVLGYGSTDYKTCKSDVCDWTVPEDQILDKKSDLVGSSGGGVAGPLVALGVAGAAAAYYYMYLM